MQRPLRRPSTHSRIVRLGLFAGVVIAVSGYVWANLPREAPDVTWRELTLDVEGMDCAFWCPVKVSTAIDGLDGAQVDRVDVRNGAVTLRYDPARRKPGEFERVLASRGFPVTASHEGR